jgi:hypothetical protein
MMANRGLGSPSQCGGPDRLLMSPSGRTSPFRSGSGKVRNRRRAAGALGATKRQVLPQTSDLTHHLFSAVRRCRWQRDVHPSTQAVLDNRSRRTAGPIAIGLGPCGNR